ncbi:MAG: DUF4381 domain-containing protein [Hahellaceae bacterium]|jgi:hypothetical protein|nr:DUF4381 domain-containing protein [Hahellaceae bacterium]
MNAPSPQDLGLHDILLPLQPSWWPLPWSAWVALGMTLLMLGLILWAIRPRVLRRKRWRAALREWQRIRVSGQTTPNQLGQINQVLKRLAVASGHIEAAPMTGSDWEAFLSHRLPSEDATILRQYLASLYQGAPQIDLTEIDTCSKRWLRSLAC